MKNNDDINVEGIKVEDKWMLGEDIPDVDPSFAQIWLSCFTNEFRQPSGKAYKRIVTIFEGYHLWFYFLEKDSDDVAKNIVSRFVKEPEFAVEVNKEIVKEADKLRRFADKVPQENLKRLSNQELSGFYCKHDKIHSEYYQWCWIPVAADMFHNNLTETFKNYLKGIGVDDENLNETFVILTHPTKKSLIQKEHEEFLKIAMNIQQDPYHKKLFKDLFKVFKEQEAAPYGLATHTPEYEGALEKKAASIKDKIKPEIYKMIEEHFRNYFYVKHMWIGKSGVYNLDYYIKELIKLIGLEGDAGQLLNDKEEEEKEMIIKREKLIDHLGIEGKWKTLFVSFGDFMVTKIYRRYAQIYALYRMQAVYEEIAERLGITLMEMRFMLVKEVKDALVNGGSVDKNELKQRTEFCVYDVEEGREDIFVGNDAKKLADSVKADIKDYVETDELKGQTGCLGRAKGEVKIIIRPSDMSKMKVGDILVSIATDPDIVPAMKKAAAIVTEQGGVTSHAAIVARELNIPCVIGTKIATKVLKDGDIVEVDADKGVVRKVK